MRYQITDNKKKLLIGVVVIIIMAITPFLFYFYKIVPKGVTSWDFLFFTIESNGFKSVQIFSHAFFTKLTFVISFSIWFITCKYWWKWVLLIPLVMFLFQLTGVLNQNIKYIDEYDFWYSLPVTIPVLGFLLWLRKKLNFYTNALDIKDDIDNKITDLQKEELTKLTQEIYDQ